MIWEELILKYLKLLPLCTDSEIWQEESELSPWFLRCDLREMLCFFPDITDTYYDAGQSVCLQVPVSLAGRRFAYRHRYVCRNLRWCLLSAWFLSTNTHIKGPIINSSSIYLHLTLNLFTYFHKTRYGRCDYRRPQCVTPQFTTSSNNNMVERRSCVT
jgi:hypothetical protein